ncbi:MAG: hypothetical protein Q9164_007564 [Protoblastenia rupestris]
MLSFILTPTHKLEEAYDLLLNLGGAEIINAPVFYTDGFTLLHESVASAMEGEVCLTLSKGPDLYPLGFNSDFTPQKETPTSLAMYSSWAFTDWLYGLIAIKVDLEEFIEQELERNYVVHAGWNKQTLLDLFAFDYAPDLDLRGVWTCSDCTEEIPAIRVQPYWRHFLEQIKQRQVPDTSAKDDSEVYAKENADCASITESAISSSDQTYKPDITEHAPFVDLVELPSEPESESESELGSEEDAYGYPATIPIRSDCVQTGTRKSPYTRKGRFAIYFDENSNLVEDSTSRDESPEDEYSPYHIHS